MEQFSGHWVWWVLGLIAIIVVGDELYFRVERQRLRRENKLAQMVEPTDTAHRLVVISNDNDEMVFHGSTDEVYDWLCESRVGTYDVYSPRTGLTISATEFTDGYSRYI